MNMHLAPRSAVLVLAVLVLAAPLARGQAPTALSYQGFLEAAGQPVTDPAATLTFRLFSAATGGSELWAETQTGVAIADGVFAADLGTATPLGAELFFGPLYLSVAVGDASAAQLAPRTALRAAPYARTLAAPATVFGDDPGPLLSVQNTRGGAFGNGLYAETGATGGRAVYGLASASTGANVGVFGQTESQGGYGVYGLATASSGSNIGVRGESAGDGGIGVYGSGALYGVRAGGGVYGLFASGSSYGVLAFATNANGTAGVFGGNVNVQGTLTKGGGAFQIDHPLAPATRILRHSFVESPDMMNVYNGTTTTDAAGRAAVALPAYFEALNRDFRYQLTTIGSFARAMVAEEVAGNRFVIRTDAPNVRVSWQVTGIRRDAWANENRIVVEEDKPADDRGRYLHPSAFGLAREQGVDYDAEREALGARMAEAPAAALPRTP